jgi:hypothetical protein
MKRIKTKFKNLLLFIFLTALILIIFYSWFTLKEIASGDTGFNFKESLLDSSLGFFLWETRYSLGRFSSLLGPYLYAYSLPIILTKLGLSWFLTERLVWYWQFLGLSIFSSWYLLKTLLPEVKFRFLAPFIYLFNTYIFMVVGGGQVSIFLAYAIAPLVLALFIQKKPILAGLALAAQISFEPRSAYIILMAVAVYQLLNCGLRISNWVKNFGVPLIIAGLLHFYWVLPTLILRKASFSPSLAAKGWAEYLSFARFSDAFSLFHPNWPENIFGKTGFFQPEFLIYPMLAYSALFFVKRNKNIIFFSLLGLLGAFLAKGVNPPFGGIYRWLFENLPGMNLYRDPTKFYLLTALSYSLLIPFSLQEITLKIKPKWRNGILVLAVALILFPIRPAILGQLGGTFKTREVPSEYLILKDFLAAQPDFSRTFWIPKHQRFGFFSNNHPAISSEYLMTDSVCEEPFCSLKMEISDEWGINCLPNDRCYVRELSYFLNPKTKDILSQMGVKYVVIPFDPGGELFVAEYKYNSQQRQETEEFLDTISWLEKLSGFGSIAVYELPEPKDHFFFEFGGEVVDWQMINPTKYLVKVKISQPSARLVFSETHDTYWQANGVSSEKFSFGLNSFILSNPGEQQLIVEFTPQKYVYWGGIVSLLTLTICVVSLIYWPNKG